MWGDVWAPRPRRSRAGRVRPESGAPRKPSQSRLSVRDPGNTPRAQGLRRPFAGPVHGRDTVGRPALAVLPPLSIFKVDLFSRFFFFFFFLVTSNTRCGAQARHPHRAQAPPRESGAPIRPL